MDLITIQGTGLGHSPPRTVDEDRQRAIAETRRDALLRVSLSPEVVREHEVRHSQGTPEFLQDMEKILSAADDFIVDTVSSQESYMPSGRFRTIYTYVIDAERLKTFLLVENIIRLRTLERDVPPPRAAASPAPASPPDPVDLTVAIPTHTIITRGEVRTRPTLKSRIAETLPTGINVRVRQEFIGPGCEWHEIVVAHETADPIMRLRLSQFGSHRKQGVYIHRSQLARLPDTRPSLEIACACRKDKNYTPPDWRNMPAQSPFLDKSRCEYSAVVTTSYTDTGGIELNARKTQAISTGIMKLLKFYDKEILFRGDTNLTLRRLTGEVFQFAYVEPGACGWHLDTRPGSKLKVLVRVPAKYFDALPRSLEDLSTVANVEIAAVPSDSPPPTGNDSDINPEVADSEISPSEQPVINQDGYRVAHFVIKRLKKKIKLIGKMLESTNSLIQGFRGSVSVGGLPIDLKKEYSLLEQCPTAIARLLAQNGFKIGAMDDTVEIGFNKGFGVEYVLSNKGIASVPCKIGFHDWRQESPIDNPTTMALLFYLDDLVKVAQLADIDAGPWTELVGNYIFPVPDVKLSSGFPKVGMPNFSLPDFGGAGAAGGSLPSFDLNTDFNLDISNKMKGLQFKFDGMSLKSLDDLNMEDISIKMPELKLKLADLRLGKMDFIGDSLFANAKDLIPKIGSLDDIFGEFLNKVSLPDIAKLLASLSAPELSFPDIMGSISESAMKFGSLGDIKNIFNELPTIPKMKINALLGSFNTGMDFQAAWDTNLLGELGRLELRRAGEISLKISELGLGRFPKLSEIDFNLDDYTRALGDAVGSIDLGSLEGNIGAAGFLKDLNLGAGLMNLSPDDLSFASIDSLLTGGRVLDLRGKLSLDGVDLDLGDIKQFVDIQSSPDIMTGLSSTAEGILNRYGKDLTAEADILREAMTAFCDGPTLAAAVEKRLPEAFSKVKGLLDGKATRAISQVTSVMDNIPTLKLPEEFPIFDSEPTDEEVVDAIKEAVTTALESMVKEMLDQISEFAIGLLPASPDVLPAGSVDMGSSMRDTSAETLANKLRTDGLDPSVLVPPVAILDEEIDGVEVAESSAVSGGDAIKRFLQDISAFLRPDEVCTLFEGKPSQSTAKMVKGLVRERYPSLHDHFSSTSSVTSFFAYLGAFVDPGLCRGIKEKMTQVNPPIVSGLPCAPNNQINLREQLLDGRASNEQISDLLGKIKDRKKKRLTELLDIASGQSVLAGVAPPVVSDCEEESGVQPADLGTEFNAVTAGVQGILKRTTPSTEKMMETTVKSMTSGVDLAFSDDCEATLTLLIQDDEPRLINEFDNEWRDVEALLKADGVDVNDYKDIAINGMPEGRPDEDDPNISFIAKNSASAYKKDKSVLPKARTAMRRRQTVEVIHEGDHIYRGLELSVPMVKPEGATFEDNDYDKLRRVAALRREIDNKNSKLSKMEGSERSRLVVDLRGKKTALADLEEEFQDVESFKGAQGAISSGFSPLTLRSLGQRYTLEYEHGASKKRKQINISQPLSPYSVEWLGDRYTTGERDSRAEYFANVLWEGFRETLNPEERTFFHDETEGFGSYFNFLADSIYANFTARIIRYLLNRVSESSFFIPKLVSELELNAGEHGYESGDPCKITPPEGLLRVKHVKDAIKTNYRNSCGTLDPNKTGPLQRAMSGGIVDLIVRVGVIENYIKGIQAMQRFNITDTGLHMLRDFIASKIQTDVNYSYGGKNFGKDFFKEISQPFIEKVATGPVLRDPLGDNDPLYRDKESFLNDPNTIDGTNALKYRVSKVLLLLRASLEEQFNDMGITSEGNLSAELFTNKPMVDVPSYKEQTRLFGQIRVTEASGLTRTDTVVPHPRRGVLRDKDVHTLPSEGGDFMYEKYFRVQPIRPDDGDPQHIREFKEEVLALFEDFDVVPTYVEGDVLDHGHFNKTNDELLTWEVAGVRNPSRAEASTSPRFGRADPEKGVVLSSFTFRRLLNKVAGMIRDNAAVRGSASPLARFLRVQVGVRYVYVARQEQFGFQMYETFAPSTRDNDNRVVNIIQNRVASREKCLFLREHMVEIRKTHGFGGVSVTTRGTAIKPIVSIPIHSAEENLPLPFSDQDLQNNFEGLWNAGTSLHSALKQDVSLSNTVQNLFKEVFPLEMFVSLATVYNVQAAELSVFELNRAFITTKEKLRSSFYSLRSSGNDMSTEEDQKNKAMGGQAGILKSLKNGSSHRPPVSFPALWQIAAQTIPTLIKGAAAELDPHYSLVNKIDSALEMAGVGGFPTGMTWASVPVFWPINLSPLPLFIGWGPPLTPLGMLAYSFADYDMGEKKRRRKRKAIKSAGKKCD